ncbi:hypothetical protein ACI2J4_12860 [Agrobacterium tumefaciens]|uniref:hypothetical protein n=1 Tax=Agrobacterium tumefaciens TaxID=358 RepID=UPI00384D4FB4
MRRHEILTLFIDWPVSLVEEGIDFPLRIVHPQGRHAPAKLRAFVDMAAASLRENRLLNQPFNITKRSLNV